VLFFGTTESRALPLFGVRGDWSGKGGRSSCARYPTLPHDETVCRGWGTQKQIPCGDDN
jgi:hypothetical protein